MAGAQFHLFVFGQWGVNLAAVVDVAGFFKGLHQQFDAGLHNFCQHRPDFLHQMQRFSECPAQAVRQIGDAQRSGNQRHQRPKHHANQRFANHASAYPGDFYQQFSPRVHPQVKDNAARQQVQHGFVIEQGEQFTGQLLAGGQNGLNIRAVELADLRVQRAGSLIDFGGVFFRVGNDVIRRFGVAPYAA
ncbi:hypothetical protein HmCmsJML188_03400 [Escherichia coli]|nr:hypothetical protein HmCmsJML188_03400 [Escherichia coli]